VFGRHPRAPQALPVRLPFSKKEFKMNRLGNSLARKGRSPLVVAALLVALACGMLPFLSEGTHADLQGPGAGERRVTLSVATLLQRLHLARRPLDDELSAACLDGFLKTLDPMKLHFLQADIDDFSKSRTEIDDQMKQGDIALAYQIFKRFLQRVEERNVVVDELLAAEHDFTVDEFMVTDRDLLNYPKDQTELRERWRKRIKYDLLVQKADDIDLAEAKEKLKRRYHSYAKRMSQTDNDELMEMYLSAMSTGFDPHTTYMSASTLENFEISMRLELDGIGASLQYEDGYTVVHKIIPGGAADKDGRLKVEDKIVSVGQGPDGEMVDVVDMKLGDVVKYIRGKRGTIVRLGVIPGGTTKQEIYNVTRARIELTDSEARAEIITEGVKADGTPFKVGVIDLPSFYMDMAGARLGRPDYKSTTRDVRKILDDFEAKGVDAVMIDLRRNGGGSLTEAVNLTGLFIESGPVVQVKGFDGAVEPYDDRDAEMAYTGPLVVLTSKFSASASEIFAGAIQDYGRGIIVGDKTTHGKGTVQQLLDLGHQIFRIPNAPKLGALKITIQQFYRPSGDSTQERGVVSDIELPSLTTHLDVGEADLEHALAFNKVDEAPHKRYGQVEKNTLDALIARSRARRTESEDFKKVQTSIERYLEQKKRKKVTLNEEKFLAERKELDADREQEKQFEELNDPNRPIVKQDYYFKEAAAITRDYVDALAKNKVAGVR
jgi:carboxyl-terminal processing protease